MRSRRHRIEHATRSMRRRARLFVAPRGRERCPQCLWTSLRTGMCGLR
ncbi:hypothetical protein [Lysobacter gummosus]